MDTVISLEDKYTSSGLAFLTGIQALVRLPMLQKQRDEAQGLDTAGYISGYRGSPLARVDQELWRAKKHLDAKRIHFAPGINEDLAATSVWGSQQAEANGTGRYEGVFAMWYAKGPGIDRSGDALRHANLAGSSALGGVLALLGDDHTCESSSTLHQSEFAMIDYMIPVLNPAGIHELIEYGLHAWAMSRFSGVWVGMKCIHDIVEASAVVDLSLGGFDVKPATDFVPPPGGLNLRIPDDPFAQEVRLHRYKLAAAKAYVRANGLDRILVDAPTAKLGVITTGKAHLDFLQALTDLGLSLDDLGQRGVRVCKVGMTWPLEPTVMTNFCRGLDSVLVIEEKRGLIEPQLKEILYGTADAPVIVGKTDEAGEALLPSTGALSAALIATVLGRRILPLLRDARLESALAEIAARQGESVKADAGLLRRPYFCAGCPHNSSTKVPEGSRAVAGTGCSYMVQWMDRRTHGYTQMGADGTTWIGEAPFSTQPHIFQNMGDGTYYHSGLMAIRAAVAAGINITYKILYNDAVAMTGGQAHDGPLTVRSIVDQVLAEGVARIAVLSDDPGKYAPFGRGVTIHDRREIDALQRELRETPGVSILIYDQTCAAEKRRRRKKGTYPDPDRRVFINELVCEGCGDCGVQSNCVAILPSETEFGRKRKIDQSACNKDFSCLEGFCPSFVTVRGAKVRKGSAASGGIDDLPEPALPPIETDYSIVLAGIGGTGIVTVGALLGMAARIDNRGCALLDMTGLAQKGGSVISHVRILPDSRQAAASRVGVGGADLILGADILVTRNATLDTVWRGHTRAIVNTEEVFPGDFARNPDFRFPSASLRAAIERALGPENVTFIDATRIATARFGDSITTNLFLLGFAHQRGLIPLTVRAIESAIGLNGVAVHENTEAFRYGRLAALDEAIRAPAPAKVDPATMPLEELIDRRAAFLRGYQNADYAGAYRRMVEDVRRVEAARVGAPAEPLTRAVAINLAKLMAYKDEYEIARLYSDGSFHRSIDAQFSGDFRINLHLAPPILSHPDPTTGRPRKREFGPWMLSALSVLAKLKGLRGTALDPFSHTAERRAERRLIDDYRADLRAIMAELRPANHGIAVRIAAVPEMIRGFGPVKAAAIQAANDLARKLRTEFQASADRASGRQPAEPSPVTA